jgi:hypothetical protein
MSFSNAVFWILVVYAVYYSLLFITDAFSGRNRKDISPVQVISVPKPEDQPRFVDYSDYMPGQVSVEEPQKNEEPSDMSDDKAGGSGSMEEEIKLTDPAILPQTTNDLDKIIADIPVTGQQVEVSFCISEFLEATNEDSLLRQGLRSAGNMVF